MKRLFAFYFLLSFLISQTCWGAYNVSICAIFKNEAPFLKEWLEFHKIQGVEHFFLYNNNSSDEYLDVLDPYINAGEVTLTDWLFDYPPQTKDNVPASAIPWLQVQCNAYKDCITHAKDLSSWIAFLDIDEFLFCLDGESLPDFLQNFKEFGGLGVNWLNFGTSGIKDIPKNSLLIEVLTKCSPLKHYFNTFMKSIVNPRKVVDCVNPHYFHYKKPYSAVDSNKNILKNSVSLPMSSFPLEKIRINHYWTRTENYFYKKKMASRLSRRTFQDSAYMLNRQKDFNLCEDYCIQKFAPQLRAKMQLPE